MREKKNAGQVYVRLGKSEMDAINKLREENDVPLSVLFRYAIRKYLIDRPVDKDELFLL